MIRRCGAVAALFTFTAAWIAGAGDSRSFWNEKEPAEWSDRDVQQLRTDSPWARVGSAEAVLDRKSGQEEMWKRKGDRVPIVGPDGKELSTRTEPTKPAAPGPTGSLPKLRVLVRWESAEPLLAATPGQSAADAAKFYIVSVSGLMTGDLANASQSEPASTEERDAVLERVMRASFLLRVGKDPIPATGIRKASLDGVVSLYFPRASGPIDAADREVAFVTKVGLFELKVKFPLKAMRYRGKLAL
ncbi:MAG: hypothetical protein P4K98_12615 [Bryobacteraceae bacterium]|nr:hypothetical protein [Bryobacteraceae bacterium]